MPTDLKLVRRLIDKAERGKAEIVCTNPHLAIGGKYKFKDDWHWTQQTIWISQDDDDATVWADRQDLYLEGPDDSGVNCESNGDAILLPSDLGLRTFRLLQPDFHGS
jgi:hypothetical protein